MRQRARHGASGLQFLILSVLTVVLTYRFLRVHATRPIAANDLPAHAWFGWADQGAYYRAARAWASFNLDPSQHHYPAGYALLAAIFVPFVPQEPFILVDLLCWAASLWVFAALAAQVEPRIGSARVVGGLVFYAVTVTNRSVFYTWETPWTSTPACLCTLSAMLMALRYGDTARPRHAVLAAFWCGLIILFRPTDFAVMAPLVGGFLALAAWRHAPRPTLAGVGVQGVLAFGIGPALLVITHVATHGLTLGGYVESAGRVGFEWRLLPLRWVTLMLNPQPLYANAGMPRAFWGFGLAQIYWWILPGIAGMTACSLAAQGRRLQHAFIGLSAIVFVCVYLCYRDLHVPGLFGYMNQHYFKWVVPVFALYALGLVHLLVVRRRFAACAAGAVAVLAVSCWRAELVIVTRDSAAYIQPDGQGVALPVGLWPLDTAYLVPSPDDYVGLYLGQHTLQQSGATTLLANAAFKVVPVSFGFMLFPLRPIPPRPAVLHMQAKLHLDPSRPVLAARQSIVFGLPCAILPARSVCRTVDYLQPPR